MAFQLWKHIRIPPPTIIHTHRRWEAEVKRARQSCQRMLNRFNEEVLEYYTGCNFEEHQQVVKEYNSNRSGARRDALQAQILKQFNDTFANVSPNPFSTRIRSSDGILLVTCFQVAAPPGILSENLEMRKGGLKPSVHSQPTAHHLSQANEKYFHGVPVSLIYFMCHQRLIHFSGRCD